MVAKRLLSVGISERVISTPITIEAKRNITSVSTDDIIVYSGSIVMHTLGLSSASLSDYIYDPDYGDYHYDWVIATSEEIASTSHNKNQCAICEYWH